MRIKYAILLGVTLLGLSAAPASAQWFVTPYGGGNFGGDTTDAKVNLGAGVGFLGAGKFGFEADFGYSPNFFETTTPNNNGFEFTNDSNVVTLTGNVIVGAPIGGHGGSIRPYLVGGVGLIRTKVADVPGVFDVSSKNDFGFDVGAGVMGFFAQNIGLRGDFRYFRSFQGSSDNVTGLGLDNFQFWRGSAGVTFKF